MALGRANPDDRNRLLASLAPTDLALLMQQRSDVHLNQGILLQEVDQPIEMVYFPQSGMISLLVVMESGEGVETATIGREGAVNASVGLGGYSSPGRAVVQVEGTFTQIRASRFQSAMDASPAIRRLIGRYNDVQNSAVYQSVGCNALHRVEARLCRWLLQTQDRADSDIFPLTQDFLSQMLGVQRTTVTVLARQLQDEGVIKYRRGRIEVTDRIGLESKACECDKRIHNRIGSVFL